MQPFGTMPQEPCYPGKGAEPDCIMQLSCEEVRTHASYVKQPQHGELQRPSNKNDPPFRGTIINSY